MFNKDQQVNNHLALWLSINHCLVKYFIPRVFNFPYSTNRYREMRC